MSKVLGENMAALIYRDGMWKPYVCSRSISFNVSTDFIETSVTGTGNWATSKPTKNSWTGSADGVISLNAGSSLTLADLRSMQYGQELFLLRWTRTDLDGNVYTDEGYAYIANSSDTGSFDNVATFTIEFKGTGPIKQVYTPTETTGIVTRNEYEGIGGEYFFESTSLYLKDIVTVDKDGIGRAKLIVIGTPDPATKEVLYEDDIGGGQGRLTFAQPFEANEMCVYITQSQ